MAGLFCATGRLEYGISRFDDSGIETNTAPAAIPEFSVWQFRKREQQRTSHDSGIENNIALVTIPELSFPSFPQFRQQSSDAQ
jgi:hypothetical protein